MRPLAPGAHSKQSQASGGCRSQPTFSVAPPLEETSKSTKDRLFGSTDSLLSGFFDGWNWLDTWFGLFCLGLFDGIWLDYVRLRNGMKWVSCLMES